MDDSSSSDEEIKESPKSPKSGGKKLKLNDGSSQDSFKEKVSSPKDENIDSGISGDKSESTSSDDRTAGTSGEPSNEVVNAAPSTSNVHAIFLNLRRPNLRLSRNYRKRKTPDRDTDSNTSSRDSDDLSADELPEPRRPADSSNSDTESVTFLNLTDLRNSDYGFQSPIYTSTDSNSGYDSNVLGTPLDDTDSDDADMETRSNAENDSAQDPGKIPEVMLKERPKHTYIILKEIINREMGLTFPPCKTTKEDVMFEKRFYGSLHAVYRMDELHRLNRHRGCVNSINFHPEGKLLVSGSDDTNIVVWDWARRVDLQVIKTGHKSNVFQSKFLYLNAESQLNIVTCARDGQVRLVQCPPSGGPGVLRRRLASHARAAHKLHVSPHEPHLVLSAGEDGLVLQCDVRADHAAKLIHIKDRGVVIPLYSVVGHPLDPRELLIAGRDKFVRVYDRRKSNKPVAMYCPPFAVDKSTPYTYAYRLKQSMMHLTCAVYNYNGSEILGSYNDEDIYLFDALHDVYDKDNPQGKEGYTHRYSGHRNSTTFKGVAFFGPRSEYVVSGSDCAYIYIWDKKTESIVQWLYGDYGDYGVVNCIEAHPQCPILATSGLDRDVKIWVPKSETDPTFKGMEKVIRNNRGASFSGPLFSDFLPTLYSAWRNESRLFLADEPASGPDALHYGSTIDLDDNVCTTF